MITSIYGALLALMLVGLSVHVIKGRRLMSIGLGDSDNIEMKRRIRAQANFAEYTPFFLILLGFAEYNGLAPWAINLIAILFLAGRVMHAYSLLRAETYSDDKLTSKPTWRIKGMVCTLTSLIILSLVLLIQRIV
jgi:uncharacterized protein